MSVRFGETGEIATTPQESASLLSHAPLSLPSSPIQSQVDGLVGGFADTATDWRSLASMLAGGLAYRAGRIGVMGLGNSSVLRAASVGLGLTAEVSTFEFAHRGLTALGRSPGTVPTNLWSWNGNGGIRQGLLQSFITFGALKGAGRLAQGENVLAQHLFQDSAMVLGHQVTGALGIAPRPAGSLAEQFLHAEATNLQIGAGMALAGRFAPGLQALERGLDLSFVPQPEFPSQSSILDPVLLSAAGEGGTAARGPEPETREPTIFKMAGQGGKGSGGGKPPRRSPLTLIKGSEPPTTPREISLFAGEKAPREVRILEKAIRGILERGLSQEEFEQKRRQLQEELRKVSLSSRRSPEREFFFGLSRNILSDIFEAMEYDAPPHPFQAGHLRVVDDFRLSPETRDLLNETELRLYFGDKFLSYEVYRPEEVTVFQHLEEGRIALILRSHAVLRAKVPGVSRFRRPQISYLSTAQIKDLQAQIDETFQATECMIPGVLLMHEPNSLKWLLEFWAPPAGLQLDLFRTLLKGPVERLSKNPEMRYVDEIKVELRTRQASTTVSFARSSGKNGFFQFIPME